MYIVYSIYIESWEIFEQCFAAFCQKLKGSTEKVAAPPPNTQWQCWEEFGRAAKETSSQWTEIGFSSL